MTHPSAFALSLLTSIGTSSCGAPAPPSPSAIADENSRPGDPSWQSGKAPADEALEVYLRPLSARAGDSVAVQINASAPTPVSWELWRLGAYHGAGARRVADGGPLTVMPQPAPTIDPGTGLLECHWATAMQLALGADWLSGLYLLRIIAPDGGARFAPLVLRDDRHADVLVVLPTATEAAYNAWGGESLYSDTRFAFPVGHAYEVSYDRPFAAGLGAGSLLARAMATARYLEANGYDVTYVADHDVAGTPSPLGRARLALVLGHDEYWTRSMRDHYEQARDGGVSLAYLGANIGFWQIRFAPATDGMPDRRQVGYKEAVALDPLYGTPGADVTGAFRAAEVGRPENALLGVMSIDWHEVDFPWVVSDPSSWLYAGMDVAAGDVFPGLVGGETDGLWANGAAPAGLLVVADSPTIGGDTNRLNRSQATISEWPSGSFVFAGASLRLPETMSGDRGNRGAQRMLANLVAHAGGRPFTPGDTLGAADGFAPADPAREAASVTLLAGGAGQPGYADGDASVARFNSPTGIALAPDGSILVADTGNFRVRRVAAQAGNAVSTVAGSGLAGDADGPAASAGFRALWGVATAADGTIYVTEPHAQRVRRIAADGTVAVFARGDTVRQPAGIAVDAHGTVYVSDVLDGQVHAFSPDGSGHHLVPVSARPDGDAVYPTGLALEDGRLVIVDSGNNRLLRLEPDGTLHALVGGDGGYADGPLASARFRPILGAAALGGALVFADTGNWRIRLLDESAGRVYTVAGNGRQSSADGPGAAAGLVVPTGLAADPTAGVVYFSDTGNATIRRVVLAK